MSEICSEEKRIQDALADFPYTRNKLVFGLIGAGKWGEHYLRVLKESSHELIGVAVRTPGTKERLERENPGLKVTMDYKELLKNKAVDCVVVVTPPGTHFEIVREAILAGKHVLCEKPLTTSLESTIELKKLCEENNTKLMVGYQYLHNNYVKEIKRLVETSFKDCKYFSWHLSFKDLNRVDNPLFLDAGCHFISLLIYLFDFKDYKVISFSKNNEEFFTINLFLDNDKQCSLSVSNFSDIKVNSMFLIGDNHLALNQSGLDAGMLVDNKKVVLDYPEPLVEQLNCFVDYVLYNKPCFSGVDNSVRVSRILEEIQKSG